MSDRMNITVRLPDCNIAIYGWLKLHADNWPSWMIEHNESMFVMLEVISRQHELHTVHNLEQTLEQNEVKKTWKHSIYLTDHIESLPGRVEHVSEAPVQPPV